MDENNAALANTTNFPISLDIQCLPCARKAPNLSCTTTRNQSCQPRKSIWPWTAKWLRLEPRPAAPEWCSWTGKVSTLWEGFLGWKALQDSLTLIVCSGRIILDEYTKPRQEVTDYRTFVSGITPEDLVDAPAFEQVREKVKELLEGKILVGHALTNDLKCLELEHPWQMIRDTACYEPFMKNHFGVLLPRKLKELSKEKLQREIQVDGNAHSPVEDAVAALDLYKSHRPRWEACILNQMKEGQKILNIQQSMPEENYQDFYAGLPIPVYP